MKNILIYKHNYQKIHFPPKYEANQPCKNEGKNQRNVVARLDK